MPPSTFASAAAGNSSGNNQQTQTRDGAAEWARRTNGATQTFRRPSQPPSASTTPSQDPTSTPGAAAASHPAPRYVPPHRNGASSDMRYTKEQLLELYRAQQTLPGGLKEGLSELFVGAWHPDGTNGPAPTTWGRSDNNRDSQPGPDVCWDKEGASEPLGLVSMDDQEKELFTTSVNTPLKPPSMNKENQQANGLPGRKVSVSGGAPGGYGLPSPSVTRGMGRRRETSESYPFPSAAQVASPGGDQRTSSPPPSLLRRRTDIQDPGQDRDSDVDEKSATTPFGTVRRNPAGPPSAGFNVPSSPWSANLPQSAGMAPMGSFGNFGIGGAHSAPGDKRGGIGSGRAESRFKNVLNKDANDDRALESKASQASLSKVYEANESWNEQDQPGEDNEDDGPSGSAALAATSDMSPPQPRAGGRGFGTPNRSNTHDDYGFGAFGMTSDNAHGFGQGFLHGREAFQQTPSAQRVAQQMAGHEPMSPTDTNPYQSPEQHGVDRLTEDHDAEGADGGNSRLPGLGGFPHGANQQFGLGGLGGFGSLNRAPGPQGVAGDRSQTSSVGPSHGFGGLGGLGQLGGTPGVWPMASGGFGTPGRQSAGLSNAFGGGIFGGPSGDMQSPGLAGLGGTGILGSQSGSRMAGMFGAAGLQEQRPADRDASNERSATQPLGALGENHRDSDSPFTGDGPASQGHKQGLEGLGQSQADAATTSQPPPPQQRTMVMPDRMRWIYRDPQGQTQGPWSGLEMHDWYKAGFFSPELLVKKYEDPEYEPLAQLIRRIGNSREPFLVPQIGIPHGPPSSAGPNAWAGGQIGGSASAAGVTQPPFASSFPSFGTTLTAEQQNALERRKQEEQYLMARQKEHLAQAQMAQRMHGHHAGGYLPGQLHHHSSAHSLHSQPSFGSIASPGGFQAGAIGGLGSNIAPGGPGFFDASMRQAPAGGLGAVGAGVESLGHIREEDLPGMLNRLDVGGNRAAPAQFGAPGQPFTQTPQAGQGTHEQQIQQMLQDRARLQEEQDVAQAQSDEDEDDEDDEDGQPAQNERLQEFQRLQNQQASTGIDARFRNAAIQEAPASTGGVPVAQATTGTTELKAAHEQLSLTEQVQKAASAQESPAVGLPQPFPPAPSQSPLPAPAAQRTGRQSFADHLQSESRDRSQTPSVDTPSIAVAPWAKETIEAPKGPSLKEIQEAEARKAAEAEELASAARRAAFQKEMEAQAAAVVASQPGLPATASWATAGSPATPTGGVSPWAKAAQKTSTPAAAKSMAQIQKEEEARKRRLAAQQATAQASAMAAIPSPAGGKSYANLAGKVGSPIAAPNVAGSAWTTVGAGGKTKTPGPVAPAATRAVSSSILPTVQNATVRKQPQRSTTMSVSGTVNAQEEFRKWAIGELRPDLNKGISVDEFVNGLFFLPLEPEMITEAVHGASSTIDSRHFAEEFIRRKKLADKGQIDWTAPPKSASPAHAGGSASGGWSEVAKKGPTKEPARGVEESNGSFRVVAAKKKGGKR